MPSVIYSVRISNCVRFHVFVILYCKRSDEEGVPLMNKQIFIIAFVVSMACGTIGAQAQQRQGHIKDELKGAVTVTDGMVAPIRFVPQEVWYDILLEDPRYGKYKGGHTNLNIQWDKNGDLVFSSEDEVENQVFSVEMSSSKNSMKTYVDPDTGRTTKIELKGKGKVRGLWQIGKYLSPESSVEIEKTAYFDWGKNQITIVYGNDVHRRTIQIEKGSSSLVSYFAFMMKLKGKEGQLYHFKTFDVMSEKFIDTYLKYEGKRDNGIHKFTTVPAGWGDESFTAFWFGPPTEEAPNGKFEKIILNPVITRYLTLLPVSKEKALGPVTPLKD